MRLDHIAYRVVDKKKVSDFFINAFGYRIEDEFRIDFEDGSCAMCYALSPTERAPVSSVFSAWTLPGSGNEYHIPPEIFVSEGTTGSIVDSWVKSRGGTGGIHHLAYQVDDVKLTMDEWISNGWAEFTTDEPITSDGLTQCFTKEHHLTGVIYEFIFRTDKGFNINNVKDLMTSTADSS